MGKGISVYPPRHFVTPPNFKKTRWGLGLRVYASEPRQFGVKGSGYISSGLRVANFPNSAGPSGLGSFGLLGNMCL